VTRTKEDPKGWDDTGDGGELTGLNPYLERERDMNAARVSKRDYIAVQAMKGFLTHGAMGYHSSIAEAAYNLADAMIKKSLEAE